MAYSQKKYLTYKKRQEALGKKQINLVLEERIANALQKELRGEKKILFEYKLKSYFLNKKSSNPLENLESKNKENQSLSQLIYNIDLLLPNLNTKLSELNDRIKILEQKLNIDRLEYSNNNITNIDIKTLEIANESLKKINPKKTSREQRNISNNDEMLDLAIDLYKEFKSWTKVSLELAKKGYLSLKNTPYTSSNLSRAVSKYRNQNSDQ